MVVQTDTTKTIIRVATTAALRSTGGFMAWLLEADER
jgi:hypothetical protein